MKEERKRTTFDEEETQNRFIHMEKGNELTEKIKQSELHNINNKFSVGYEAMSNMKTKVSSILLPSVPDHMRVTT